MGNTGSRSFQDGVLSKKDMERMQRRFTRLANGGSKVAIADLQSLPELNGNPFISRVFQLSDADRDGYLSQKEFMAGVEKLGHLYTDDDKLAFAFAVYDKDGDGFVGPKDLRDVLRISMGKTLSDSELVKVAEATIAAHDRDGDGRLSLAEFGQLLAAGQAEDRSAA